MVFSWIGLAILVLVGAAAAHFGYRPAAAVICPTCYGFSAAVPGVFVESTTDAVAAKRALETIGSARDRVRHFYGTLESKPRILACLTEACYQRIGGGGSTGMALLDVALFLSPRGNRIVIASHEMSHIELHRRLGLRATVERKVPQWFDEGLAAMVSDDPRYLKPEGAVDRCVVETTEDLPTARSAWVIEARDRQLYAKAACRVVRWTIAHGGPKAVPALLSAVSKGATFQSLVQ